MRLLGLSLQLHKWIALIVGLQVLFWTAGGLVMTAIPIERVRSEHHAAKSALVPVPAVKALAPAAALRAAGVEAASSLQLKSTFRGPVWVVTPVSGEPVTLDAVSGQILPRLRRDEALVAAKAAYVGAGRPVAARYYAAAPQETGRAPSGGSISTMRSGPASICLRRRGRSRPGGRTSGGSTTSSGGSTSSTSNRARTSTTRCSSPSPR